MENPSLNHFIPLSNEETVRSGYSHVVKVTFADLLPMTTAATGITIDIGSIGVGMSLDKVAFDLITPFADSRDTGNNTSTLAISLGSTSLISAQETNLNGSYVTQARYDTIQGPQTNAQTLKAIFAATASGKLYSNFTQGEVHIFARIVNLARLG